MSRNKETLIRYRIINRCLIDNKVCSKEELAKACEEALDIHPFEESVIEQDLRDMQSDPTLGYSAPIQFNPEKNGYYYEDPNYSIDKFPLSDDDLKGLVFATTLLDQYQYLDLFKDFEGIVQKISDVLKIKNIEGRPSEFDFIQFEKAPRIRGRQYLSRLINFILEKKTVLIRYQPFYEEDPYMVQIHPYLLKEYQFRWYLIGLNEQVQQLRTYGLDRILMIEPAGIPFIEKNFDAQDYFRNAIGVIAPEGLPPDIKLAVKKPQASYLITKPLHESQTIIKETEIAVVFRYRVHPTWEFKSAVLALGAEAKILYPGPVRNEIVTQLKKTLVQYEKR